MTYYDMMIKKLTNLQLVSMQRAGVEKDLEVLVFWI